MDGGPGTLRQALLDAQSGDTITFDPTLFPPASPATISISSDLPPLATGNVTLDGSSAGVIVEGGDFICFYINSNSNTIKGLEIYDCGLAVWIFAGAQNNTIGGSWPGERNVISGGDHGVIIRDSGTAGNVVKGNYIGTDVSGTAAVPNSEEGVVIFDNAQNNSVEDNVISGNGGSGVMIQGSGTNGNLVKGNYIGIDPYSIALPNGQDGVLIVDGAKNSTVENNVISGNTDDGVEIRGAGTNSNVVMGNYIGTDAAGEAAMGNARGVVIDDGAKDNTIGGTAAGEGNLIAFNIFDGVWVDDAATTANTIRGNSIHSNGGKGIDNTDGGNTELSPPTVDTAGSVFGTACPNCTIDVYSDDEDEGRVYEGPTTTDGAGSWSFSGTPEGPNITATATDSDGNTSEFSAPLAPPWPAPSPSPTPSPTPGATRTLHWDPGWHNATWSGASTPEEAFACAAGNYAAAYRLVGGGWERYFPDRPDLSNMTELEQYDAFLILVTGEVICEMPVAEPPGGERLLDWGVGWQNEGWTGPGGTLPESAFACAAGNYAAAYRLVGGSWERYFPERPEISNMEPLNHYDPFLILITAPPNCGMPITP